MTEIKLKYFPADSVPYFNRPQKIKCVGEYIYILDERNQRILRFDNNFNYINQIGREGRGPGEYLYPTTFQIFKDTIYIADVSNYRIDLRFVDGKYIRSFRPKYPLLSDISLGVNSNGNLFINHPMSNNLVTCYDNSGEIVKSFGDLIDDNDPMKKISINNAHIEVGENDNIYVSFVMVPVLRKYDKNGQLLWERDLTKYSEIKEMNDFFIKKTQENPEMKYNVYFISKDIYYEPPYLYILFQGVIPYGNTVYAFDKNGELEKIIRISKGDVPIDSLHNYGKLAVDKEGHLYLSDKTDYQVVKFKYQ